MTKYAALRLAALVSTLLLVLAWWRQDALPAPERLRPELLAEPVQQAVDEPAFRRTVDAVEYGIQPRYTYDISGLIVSLHHSDTWWDTAHAEWNDHINLMDLCVVWGDNAASGVYREIHFSNTQWECHFETRSSESWQRFHLDQVSNNHLLTDDPVIARAMKSLHVGDEVRLRGYLVNYTIFDGGVARGTRVSSETRTDTGPGACEVMYVQGIDILARHNAAWRWLRMGATISLALCLGAFLVLPPHLEESG